MKDSITAGKDLGKTKRVVIAERPAAARFNLRIDPTDLAKASKAFGVEIAGTIGDRTENGTRSALCLGPDEWVLHAGEEERDAIVKAFADLYAEACHSLVVISDREIAFEIEGPGAMDVLAAGSPLDLKKIPVGSGTRTVFDSAQVVLVREAENSFLLETWRSFAPHVQGILTRARDELALDI